MTQHDDLFASTIQKTHLWVNDVMRRLDWDDPHRAFSTLRAVLHTLRDSLSVDEAAALGAQLPLLVRGAYYEGWQPAHMPRRVKLQRDFLDHVAEQLHGYEGLVDIEEATRAVLGTLSDHVSSGEAEHLARILPVDVSLLLPAY